MSVERRNARLNVVYKNKSTVSTINFTSLKTLSRLPLRSLGKEWGQRLTEKGNASQREEAETSSNLASVTKTYESPHGTLQKKNEVPGELRRREPEQRERLKKQKKKDIKASGPNGKIECA